MEKLRILLFFASVVSFMACSNQGNDEGTGDKPIVSASVASNGDVSGASAEDDHTPDIITGQARPPEPSPIVDAGQSAGVEAVAAEAGNAAGGAGTVVADAGASAGDAAGGAGTVVADAGASAGDAAGVEAVVAEVGDAAGGAETVAADAGDAAGEAEGIVAMTVNFFSGLRNLLGSPEEIAPVDGTPAAETPIPPAIGYAGSSLLNPEIGDGINMEAPPTADDAGVEVVEIPSAAEAGTDAVAGTGESSGDAMTVDVTGETDTESGSSSGFTGLLEVSNAAEDTEIQVAAEPTIEELQCLFTYYHLMDGLSFNGSEVLIDNPTEGWVRDGVPDIITKTRTPTQIFSLFGIRIVHGPSYTSFLDQVRWYVSESVPDIFSDEDMSSFWTSGLSESRLVENTVDPYYNTHAGYVTASYTYSKDNVRMERDSKVKFIDLCSPEDTQNDLCRVRVLYNGEFYMLSKLSGGDKDIWYRGPLTARIYFGSRPLDFSACTANFRATYHQTGEVQLIN